MFTKTEDRTRGVGVVGVTVNISRWGNVTHYLTPATLFVLNLAFVWMFPILTHYIWTAPVWVGYALITALGSGRSYSIPDHLERAGKCILVGNAFMLLVIYTLATRI